MWGGNWLSMLRKSMTILSLLGVSIGIVVCPASHYWSISYLFASLAKPTLVRAV